MCLKFGVPVTLVGSQPLSSILVRLFDEIRTFFERN